MGKRGSEKRRLPAQVLVRLTEDQKVAVELSAIRDQVSIATYLRFIISDSIGKKPGPITRRALPPQYIIEMAHLREVVAELGGAMVKAAVVARQDGRQAEHADIEALIPFIKAAVLDLDKLKEKLWRPAG